MMTIMALTFISVSAFASSYQQYDSNAVGLLNEVQQNCPAEFAKLMEDRNIVLKAEKQKGQGPDGSYATTILTIGIGGMAPSFHEYPVAKLMINRVALDKKQIRAPDAPTKWDTECRIVSAN